MIVHACFNCKRRFELDPVFVGFELSKLKKKNPSFYQAICPACRAINKVSIKQMQSELDSAAEQVEVMVTEYEQNKAAAKAEKKAQAKESRAASE